MAVTNRVGETNRQLGEPQGTLRHQRPPHAPPASTQYKPCDPDLAFLLPRCCSAPPFSAQTFQVVACETPVGAGGGQPIERFSVAGTNGTATRIGDIPGASVNDPVALAFDYRYELFVANRDAHHGGSTISRFVFDPTFTSFTPNGTISGNGITDAVQLAFDPVTGELFQTNFTGGLVSRFLFDAQGDAITNGTLQMPDAQNQLGVAIRPTGPAAVRVELHVRAALRAAAER